MLSRRRQSVLALVIVLGGLASLGSSHRPPYNRDLYLHWIDTDRDCQTTRFEVSVRDAEAGTVTFSDSQECAVISGTRNDPFTGNTFSASGQLDVDHMVPLKHAHEHGAWAWSAQRKKEYANHLGYRFHLLAVSSSANRSKGDKGPDQWKPANQAFWCEYAQAWAAIVNGLT